MKAIYKPKGKAREYGELACNLYRGCGHKCSYCYAPQVLRMDRQEFYDNPQPRDGIIEALKKDARIIGDKYKVRLEEYEEWYEDAQSIGVEGCGAVEYSPPPDRPEVFLCFTTDPYQPINEKYQLTRQAIEILHENEVAVNILTKGVVTDFDLLAKRPDLSRVGVTYTGANADMEPILKTNYDGLDMINNSRVARKYNIPNWVSLEPVVSVDNILNHFIPLYRYEVDLFKLGKWNYDPRAKDIDWHRFVNEAINLLEKYGCKYYIKEDLRKYI